MATLHDNDNTLLALVRTTFDAHSAVLFLPDQSGNYTVALSSTDNEPSVQEVTIAPGKGLVGWILRHKQPVIVNNLDMRHTFLGYYDENDEGAISAFMGCHIPEGGALCVDSVRPRAYTEEDQLLLHRFARHLARQVHSAGLACDAEDLRRYFTRLEQLSELSAQNPHWRDYLGAFLRLMAESTEFEYVAFATAQEGGSTYTVEGENTPLLITERRYARTASHERRPRQLGFPQRSARTCGRGRWFSQYAALRQAAGSAQLPIRHVPPRASQ